MPTTRFSKHLRMASSSAAAPAGNNPAVAVPVTPLGGDEIPPEQAAHLNAEHPGAESGSRKRKAPANRPDEEVLAMTCEVSRRVRNEIESLRSQLDLKAKELEYIEEIKKMRVKLAVQTKEMECLRKQNQDLKAEQVGLQKNRKKEDALARQLQLEKELHEKQHLELEVTRLNSRLQVMRHLEGDDDGDIHDKMEKLIENLEHEKKRLEEFCEELVTKERETNDELQVARKELITDMLSGRTAIGIKRMGELDEKPFLNACRKKFGNDDYETKALELTSSWQEEIMKPNWHPFKIISVNGEDKEVVNDDDEKLRHLWIEYGDDVCNAVKSALSEVNEYNPSGSYVVPELWNFRENRKATLKEVLKYIFRQMETTNKRRRG